MKWIKRVFFRDPIDFIVFIIVLFVFVYCFLIKKYDATGGYLAVAGYVFYVMYRFAVIYNKMDECITDPKARVFLKLKPQ